MFDKKFHCLEIDEDKKQFTIEPDTFIATNRIIYDGSITETEEGYIIDGEQHEAAVHNKDFGPVDSALVEDRFVNEYDVTHKKTVWLWKWGFLLLPYWKTTKSIRKEVKPGWVLLKRRKKVIITLMEKFTMVIEIKKEEKKEEVKDGEVKDDNVSVKNKQKKI